MEIPRRHRTEGLEGKDPAKCNTIQKPFLQVIAYTLKGRTLQNPRQMAFFAFSSKTAIAIIAQNGFAKNGQFGVVAGESCRRRWEA